MKKSRFTEAPSVFPNTDYDYTEGNSPVVNGLALTPAQMDKMARQGQAVTTQMIADDLMTEGVPNPSWDVPFINQRGVDLAGAWEAQQEAREQLQAATQKLLPTHSSE